MFTGPTQDRIQALAADVGVGTFPTYNTGNNVFWANGRRSEYPSDGPTGSAPPDPVVLPDIAAAVALLDQMATGFPVDSPWSSPNAEEWDRQTLDTWLRANTSGSAEFMAVVSAATNAIFGCEPRELSLLYTVFYIAASGDEQNQGTFERNFNTTGGAQETRFVGGAQRIALEVAARLRPRVVLNAPVRRIEHSSSGVTVYADGLSVRGRRVIVAIPPTLAGRIDYDPPLPPSARPAHAAHAAGDADEVRSDLRHALLARPGPDRTGRERERPGQGHLRLVAPRWQPRDHDGLHRRARRACVGGQACGRAPHCGARQPGQLLRQRGSQSESRSSSSTGRRRSGTAAARSPCSRPAP